MAMGFRFTAQRFHEIGFINKIVDSDDLISTAVSMAEHMLTLPPASRVNTTQMMREMKPKVSGDLEKLAEALKEHGDKNDLIESRKAFAEKRTPNFSGWNNPDDRYSPPTLDSIG